MSDCEVCCAGDEIDLVKAEKMLPEFINPLSLQIVRMTEEYPGAASSAARNSDSDTVSLDSRSAEHIYSNFTLIMDNLRTVQHCYW